MSPRNNIEKTVKQFDIDINPNRDEEIFNQLQEAMSKSKQSMPDTRPEIWSIIMKSKLTKYVAAAVIIVGVFIGVYTLNGTPAYALEQTIEANRFIRTLQLRADFGDGDYEQIDMWFKYDESGKLTNLRQNLWRYELPNEQERRKDIEYTIEFMVWNEGIYKCWIPEHNDVTIRRVNNTDEQYKKFAEEYNPRFIMQRLYDDWQYDNAYNIEIQEPQQDGDFIYVKVSNDNIRIELLVDPETKMLKQYTRYDIHEPDVDEVFEVRLEFLAYNQPIDPSVFELNEIPEDIQISDTIDRLMGLEQGNMTEEEISRQVVNAVLEATIAQDYDEVSRLTEGDPGDYVERFINESFHAKLIRVVSIGQVRPHPQWPDFYYVPCEIEIENEEQGMHTVNLIATTEPVDYQSGNRWIQSQLYNPQKGLEQGDMTDDEIAILLVREALEAAIAKDYIKVHRLTDCDLGQGESGEWIENYIVEKFGATLVQVISFGTPKLHGTSGNLFCVPCTVEIENEEMQRHTEDLKVYVRWLNYEPGNRWALLYKHIRTEEMPN